MQKFKEGQKVKVIAKRCGHEFEIGELVEIKFADQESNNGKGDYKCSNVKESWFLIDEELE